MSYTLLNYIKFKLNCFRYWLGFRTAEEHCKDGFDYAMEEMLAGREPITGSFDIDEFDAGIEEAKRQFCRNR
jgi:hypothetical protein